MGPNGGAHVTDNELVNGRNLLQHGDNDVDIGCLTVGNGNAFDWSGRLGCRDKGSKCLRPGTGSPRFGDETILQFQQGLNREHGAEYGLGALEATALNQVFERVDRATDANLAGELYAAGGEFVHAGSSGRPLRQVDGNHALGHRYGPRVNNLDGNLVGHGLSREGR